MAYSFPQFKPGRARTLPSPSVITNSLKRQSRLQKRISVRYSNVGKYVRQLLIALFAAVKYSPSKVNSADSLQEWRKKGYIYLATESRACGSRSWRDERNCTRTTQRPYTNDQFASMSVRTVPRLAWSGFTSPPISHERRTNGEHDVGRSPK